MTINRHFRDCDVQLATTVHSCVKQRYVAVRHVAIGKGKRGYV